MIEKSAGLQFNGIPGRGIQSKNIKTENAKLPGDSFVSSKNEAPPEKEWTILAYMGGSNDLKEEITGNFKEMETVGSTDKTDVAAYLSRDNMGLMGSLNRLSFGSSSAPRINPDWKGSRIYHVQKGDGGSKVSSVLLEDRGREKVNDPKTLQQFIEMGMKKFPAKHYMLVLSSHGNGFRGMILDRDDKFMKLPDVRKAVEGAEKNTGRKLDVLTMEACQMGQMETAVEFENSADFLVASPGQIYGEGINYSEFLGDLEKVQKSGEEVTPEKMVRTLVESTEKYYDDVPTLTALDLGQMAKIKTSLDEFTGALMKSGTEKKVIRELIFESPQHDTSVYSKKKASQREYVDVIGFCNRIIDSDRATDRNLKYAASKLRKSINDATVERKAHYGDSSDQGLAIYVPTNQGLLGGVDPEYDNLKIAKETKWKDYVSAGKNEGLRGLTRFIAEKIGIGERE